MPVVTVQGKQSPSSTELSGSVTTGDTFIPGGRITVRIKGTQRCISLSFIACLNVLHLFMGGNKNKGLGEIAFFIFFADSAGSYKQIRHHPNYIEQVTIGAFRRQKAATLGVPLRIILTWHPPLKTLELPGTGLVLDHWSLKFPQTGSC